MSASDSPGSTPAAFELYGLTVRSELPLSGARPVADTGEPDLTIQLSTPAPVPREVPEGQVLALWRTPEEFWHGVVRASDGVRFRVPDIADYLLTGDGEPGTHHRHVVVTPADAAQLGLAEVLASGALFAVLFELAGHPILHAGAVEIDGRAVAVVGSSGRGKSTTSALLCRAGFPLVTDDLLRLDRADDEMRCTRGTTSLRLREKAHRLVATFGGHDDTSPDGRLLLSPTPTQHQQLPLAAAVFPVPTRDGNGEVQVRRLSTAEAFDELLASPRFLGWEDPRILTQLFTLASDVARRVPAYAVEVPWSETFPDTVVRQLADRVRAVVEQQAGGGSRSTRAG